MPLTHSSLARSPRSDLVALARVAGSGRVVEHVLMCGRTFVSWVAELVCISRMNTLELHIDLLSRARPYFLTILDVSIRIGGWSLQTFHRSPRACGPDSVVILVVY